MSTHKYENDVAPGNAYGHTLALLQRHVGGGSGVHLDLACGRGAVSTYVRDDLGLEYVGVDFDQDSVNYVKELGFEAHQADLNQPDVLSVLTELLGDRPLASISCMDGLEHLTEGEHLLQAVSALLSRHRAVGVFSVPNVSHMDVAVKSWLGQWTYTDSGLLDRTHVHLYTATSLRAHLRGNGLAVIDANDVVMARSDQHFPADHGGLTHETPVGQWLREVRGRTEEHGQTNQFVWAVTAVPPAEPEDVESAGDAPMVSVIMRTQGRRIQEMREALLCLASQSERDFEVLVVAHKVSLEQQLEIEQVIADQPPFFRDRVRLYLLDAGQRAAPLNLALQHARGKYLSIFDDDDLALANWIEDFVHYGRLNPGRMIRGICLRQQVERTTVRGLIGVRGTEEYNSLYNRPFSLTEHLVANHSPTMSWAFPRTLVRDFGLTFDESMTTTEDWSFLLSAAELVGVVDTNRVASVYQWWEDHESSRTAHPFSEWMQNQTEIERRIDGRPILLPAGETRRLREVYLEHAQFRRELAASKRHIARMEARIARLTTRLESRADRIEKLRAKVSRLQDEPGSAKGQGKGSGQGRRGPAGPPAPPKPRWRSRMKSLLTGS